MLMERDCCPFCLINGADALDIEIGCSGDYDPIWEVLNCLFDALDPTSTILDRFLRIFSLSNFDPDCEQCHLQ